MKLTDGEFQIAEAKGVVVVQIEGNQKKMNHCVLYFGGINTKFGKCHKNMKKNCKSKNATHTSSTKPLTREVE